MNQADQPSINSSLHATQISLQVSLSDQDSNRICNLKCSLPYYSSTRQISINEAICAFQRSSVLLENLQMFYVDSLNKIVRFLGVYPLSETVTIPCEIAMDGSLHFICKRNKEASMIDESEVKQTCIAENTSRGRNNKKVKQRSIHEAYEAVKLWRMLYDSADKNGKRLFTLQSAAREVGVAKKTLDDYYNHIKVAEQFKFNLHRHSHQKMGLLRKYVKCAKQAGLEGLTSNFSECILDSDIEKYWTTFTSI